MNEKNNHTNISVLDVITILGYVAQLENIKSDNEQTNYIEKVIKAISDEIEKLHKENDIIIKQNEEILEILKGKERR